jgi:hypothetical protein
MAEHFPLVALIWTRKLSVTLRQINTETRNITRRVTSKTTSRDFHKFPVINIRTMEMETPRNRVHLEKLIVSQSRNSPPFMELEGSLPCSQQPNNFQALSKGKGKKLSLCCFFKRAPRHGGVLGSGVTVPLILWPRHQMEVSGHLHVPAVLSPGEDPMVPIG